jgi:hypothetical protein
MTGKWFGEDRITVEEKPDANGHLSLGPIRQGQYTLSFVDPNSGLKLERSLTLFGGRKEVLIVAPFAESTKVDLDLGLPEFADDNHQLVRSTLEFEWSEGDNIWASSVDVVIGRDRMWEVSHPDRSRAAVRSTTRVQRSAVPPSNADRLGRARQVDTRGTRGSPSRLTHYDRDELLDLRLPHRTRLQVVSLNGAIATSEGQTKEFQERIRQDSNEFLAELTAPLEMEAQEFVVGEGLNQRFEVSLPQPFLDAFTREALIQRNTLELPKLDPTLVAEMNLDFDREISIESIKVPLIEVECDAMEGTWKRLKRVDERSWIGTQQRRRHIESKGAYISIPDTLDMDTRSATARYIIVVKWNKTDQTGQLQAIAARSAMDLSGIMTAPIDVAASSAPVDLDDEPFWMAPEVNGEWLQIDITESLRSIGPNKPIQGLFLHKTDLRANGSSPIWGTSSEDSDGAEEGYPRLLIVDN